MSTFFDIPVVGVVVVALASILLFVPTIIADFRKILAFRSVSALNALTLLLVVCFLVPGWLFWGLSPLVLWGTVAIWVATTTWSLAGKRRNA